MVERHEHLAGLDDRLERVRVLRDDVHRDRGVAVVGAEARRRVGHVGPRGAAHHGAAQPLEPLLDGREVLELRDLAVADHHVGAARDDRLDELRDVARVVLVVGVGVDDDVGAELERGVEPGLEGGGEALVVRQPDDVVDAVRARDLDRAVGRAVVDHEPLDLVHARNLAREVGERPGELLFLVLAGDLDDELQGANCVRRSRALRGCSSRARARAGAASRSRPARPRRRCRSSTCAAYDSLTSRGWRSIQASSGRSARAAAALRSGAGTEQNPLLKQLFHHGGGTVAGGKLTRESTL